MPIRLHHRTLDAQSGRAQASRLAREIDSELGLALCAPGSEFRDLITGVPATNATSEAAPIQTINGLMGYRALETNVGSPAFTVDLPPPPCTSAGFSVIAQITGLLYNNHVLVDCGVGGVRGGAVTLLPPTFYGAGDAPASMRATCFGVADLAVIGGGFSAAKPSAGPVTFVLVVRAPTECFVYMNGDLLGSTTAATFIPWSAADSFRFGAAYGAPNQAFRGIVTLAGIVGAPMDAQLAQDISEDPSILLRPARRPVFYGSAPAPAFKPYWAAGATSVWSGPT